MPWVTINGNHVLIGEDDGGGRTSTAIARARAETQRRKESARAAEAIRLNRVSPASRPSKIPAEHLLNQGHTAGYKDVSNFVAGPAHTRHAIHERIARYNRAIDAGSAVRSPWWEGYRKAARQSANDWMSHMSRATGGKTTRTVQRLRALKEKI